MSGYLFLRNNLKDTKTLQAYVISCKIFFQQQGNRFQRKYAFSVLLKQFIFLNKLQSVGLKSSQ